ncbi:MAG: leucine--tRNA ligase [Chlamydiota bacterium]
MYPHRKIEKKWQRIWQDGQVYRSCTGSKKPKYYILDMFPYPSGAGLHVGHVTGYTATDILARYKRTTGYEVLHPMGWDSFGLPAEQYAIRTNTHPQVTTEKNIATYRRQLQSLGFSYDWSREVTTSSPDYYKWTQWLFTKLYEKGLAYEAHIPVNFCPAMGTVLANEEVEEGKSKEGGFPVERRPLRQWVLKITEYAERLLEDLVELDWPENLKRLQENWIGKSEGCYIDFPVLDSGQNVRAFTTRADTIFGVSYLALAPEHPLLVEITSFASRASVDDYRQISLRKSDLQRKESKEKTGVFTGAFAEHPFTKAPIPIWVADYVLADYGSGSVMGVPAGDDRDFAFAKSHNIPILPIYQPQQTACPDELDWEEFEQGVLAGKICYTKEGTLINSSHNGFSLDGLSTSAAKCAVARELEKRQSGAKALHYKLRDWLFSRQRYWGEPIPILHFPDGTKRCLEKDELPLMPPFLEDFSPSKEGKSPLQGVPSWLHIHDLKTGKNAERETNTMPQWAGSCWYYLRFLDPHNEQEPWSLEAEKYWMPVDLYVGGSEHAVLHLLYARFWHKVFYDLGLVHTKEPFRVYRNQGLVTARSYRKKSGGYVAAEEVEKLEGEYLHRNTKEPIFTQIEKMSKSKLNGVSPDEILEEYGADTLRLYEMFMGPFQKDKVWNKEAVSGCYRCLSRFYQGVFSDKICAVAAPKATRLAHRLAHLVRQDIESMQFNTAVAHFMTFLNEFLPLPAYPREALLMAVQALYPFAPHIASEMWEHLGGEGSLSFAPLFPVDPMQLQEMELTYVVQINGRLRANLHLPKDASKEEVLAKAKELENIQKHLIREIKKVIFVPNKLLNIVLEKEGS